MTDKTKQVPVKHTIEDHYDEILNNTVYFENSKYIPVVTKKSESKNIDIFEKFMEMGIIKTRTHSAKKNNDQIAINNHHTSITNNKQIKETKKSNLLSIDLIDKFVQTYDDLK